MQPRSIVGLFCEDIRAERSGAFTVVGIMPDNANIPDAPSADVQGMIPKLCVYVRANFDIADKVKKISMTMRLPDRQEIALGGAGEKLLTSAFDIAKERNSPLVTIVMRAELQAFPVVSLGRLLVEVDVDGDRSIVAQLNLAPSGAEESQPLEEINQINQRLTVKPTSSTS